MQDTTRRQFFIGTALLPLTAAATYATAAPLDTTIDKKRIRDDLNKYIDFGIKQAGGAGDNACGNWMAVELERASFTVERQNVMAPYFTPQRSELVCDGARATVWPQPIVIPTGPGGITGRIIRVDGEGQAEEALTDAIALVDLPFGRWSSALSKKIRKPIEAAFAAGASAVVAVTNGPSGKVIALNTDGRKPMFKGPVALLAPNEANPFFAAAMRKENATLYMTGKGGRRPAFNMVGRLDRGKGRWLVVSTPRSGWFGCAGERGPGIAAWLHLVRWASKSAPDYNLAFICNSGHEYQYLGAEEALKEIAPKPAETAFWLHLGANIAATDWHSITGELAPLPGADSQRYLVTSPPLLPIARQLFEGQVGLEAPYSSEVLSAGELTGIIEAGYPSVAGVFGLHRYHHVIEDDARCVSTENVVRATAAFQKLLEHVIT